MKDESWNERIRGESEEERADRNLIELLQELRVAQTGVQILFAFLLTLPFTQRFDSITPFQRIVYFVTLLLAAASTMFIIAPVAHHRILFRQHDKKHLVDVANRLALIGLIFLPLAMTGALLLITDVLFHETVVVITTAGAAALFIGLWFVVPIRRRIVDERRS
jgi:quinol-cytochrome oxidoreductase complex cytochrome b subunit